MNNQIAIFLLSVTTACLCVAVALMQRRVSQLSNRLAVSVRLTGSAVAALGAVVQAMGEEK